MTVKHLERRDPNCYSIHQCSSLLSSLLDLINSSTDCTAKLSQVLLTYIIFYILY